MYISLYDGGFTSFNKINVGFSENFVWDKTTDTAENINFILRQESEPSISINQWAVLSEDNFLTYDSNGFPLNHRQYLVAKINLQQNKTKSYWIVKLALKENIEITNGYINQTLGFTNQVEKTVDEVTEVVTYTKEPYNVYTALKRLLSVIPINSDDLTILGRDDGESLLHKIDIYDKEFLESIGFNDDTFNFGDIYTILFKVGDYLDRTPVIYFDCLGSGQNGFPVQTSYISDVSVNVYYDYLIANMNTDFEFNRNDSPFALSGLTCKSYFDLSIGKSYYMLLEDNGLIKYTLNSVESGTGSVAEILHFSTYVYRSYENVDATLIDGKYKLRFERKDGYDKDELVYDDLVLNAIDITKEQTTENYADSIISEVDNLTTDNTNTFPTVNFWIAPQYDEEVRDTTSGGTDQRGKWFIQTPSLIKRVERISKMTMYYELTGVETFSRTTTDINSEYILEEQEYKASELYETNKNDLVHYEEGSNKIYINSYYYLDDNSTAIYFVEYQPLITTSMQYGNGYATSVNQSDSQTESFKIGSYLKSYISGMSKYDISILKKYTNFEDFKDLIGSRVIKDNEEYMITRLSYQNANNVYYVAMQLNKDNLRRNINIQANRQIKTNRAIEYSNLKDRRDRLTDTINISTSSLSYSTKFLTNKLLLLSALIPTQVASNTVQLVYYTPKSTLQRTTDRVAGIDSKVYNFSNNFIVTPTKQLNYKQIQYNIVVDDNAVAGYIKTAGTSSSTGFEDVNKQYPVIYTDPFGEVQKLNLVFTYLDNSSYADSTNVSEWQRTVLLYENALAYPTVATFTYGGSTNNELLLGNSLFSIDNINYIKDMVEKLNISIIFNIEGNTNLIPCTKLYELSRLMQSSDTHTLKIYGFDTKKNENDLLSDELFSGSVTSTYDSYKISLSFTGQDYENLKSVIITTDSDEKLLIINSPNLTDVENGQIDIYY